MLPSQLEVRTERYPEEPVSSSQPTSLVTCMGISPVFLFLGSKRFLSYYVYNSGDVPVIISGIKTLKIGKRVDSVNSLVCSPPDGLGDLDLLGDLSGLQVSGGVGMGPRC